MENHEENYGVVDDNHLCDSDQGMQTIWDQLVHHSIEIIALEGQVHIGFSDINAKFDDLTKGLKHQAYAQT